jgi:hypothetical protein
MAGAPKKNSDRPASDVLDLDALLAGRRLLPKPVKFAGHTYQVRTDLTPAEIVAYHQLAGEQRDEEAFRLLVGDDAARLNEQLELTPRPHMRVVTTAILHASGCFEGFIADEEADRPGESSAS